MKWVLTPFSPSLDCPSNPERNIRDQRQAQTKSVWRQKLSFATNFPDFDTSLFQ
jgi:hypothetical protein